MSQDDIFHLENLVVPVDGHSASFRALQHALYLNRHFSRGAAVTAVYVVEPPPPTMLDDALLIASVQPGSFEQLGERVLKHCEESARHGHGAESSEATTATATSTTATATATENRPLKTLLKHGDITDAILATAQESNAHMIVMGTHGRKGFERFLLGSVTESVLRAGRIPILALRYDPRKPYQVPHYKNILVPFDGSPASEHAINYIVPFARLLHADITLLHVVDNRPALFGHSHSESDTDAAAKRALEWASNQAQQLGVQAKTVHLVTSKHPAEAIHEIEHDYDLICMGSRGLAGIKRLLLGSVTEAVLRVADKPVLVVPLGDAEEGAATASQ
eukprot:TRINITY_DN336_c0_g2_i4.p1 TRINITY_DN336_c0_g2~~TRINITY_DN336_c0_g2_i4.p1  ORF type:complete len:335 (+),score=63.11 TRINITY_DN336_c0_g2_i4:85-1089(+)